MGFGMQRWITTMQPRKFFGKANNARNEHLENIAGHDIKEFYHLKPNNLENLLRKKYSLSYRKKLIKELEQENHKQKFYGWLLIVISLVFIALLSFYLSNKFNLF